MNKSEDISSLAVAMCNFQGELPNCEKSSQGYSYKYSKFEDGINIIRPLLFKNDLFFTQVVEECGDSIKISTVIVHKSGQYISGCIVMPFEKLNKMNGPQSAGAIISYAKRYSLFAILGIATEDEDTDAAPKYVATDVSIDYLGKIKKYISYYGIGKETTDEWLKLAGAESFEKMSQSWKIKIFRNLQKKFDANSASNQSIGE